MIWRGSDAGQPGAEPAPGSQGGDADDPSSEDRRIESIFVAAERAAAEIRRDAEQRARRYYEESKRRTDEIAAQRAREMTDLADALMQTARRVAQQSDQLRRTLEEARRRMDPGSASNEKRATVSQPSPPPPDEPSAPLQGPTAPVQQPATAAPAGEQVSQEASLLATQMAIAGSRRDEIARRLRDEFGVLDPTAILNEIGA